MKLLALVLVLALLLDSLSALLPSRLVLHDHLLIGNVTAEQLRAHLAQEAQELPTPVQPVQAEDSFPPATGVAATGGRIISLLPGLVFILSLHSELALQIAFVLFVPVLCFLICLSPMRMQARLLPSPDPPPRRAAES